MTDPLAAAFLRSICERPDDDAPRLQYADWLEENGQAERGEFIRVQCELPKAAQFTKYYCDRSRFCWCEECRLRRRERELWHAHSAENPDLWFLRPMPFMATVSPSGNDTHGITPSAIVSRGFVSSISLSTRDFMRHAKAIFESQPVTSVRLTDAVVYPSGGNSTYYVGGLGRFPKEYWRGLENLPSRNAAHAALSAACVAHGRQLAGLPPLASAVAAK